MPLLEAVHEDIAIEEGDGSEDGDDSEEGVDIARIQTPNLRDSLATRSLFQRAAVITSPTMDFLPHIPDAFFTRLGEGLSYYHTLDHPAWQAGLLSRLFRWIEWAAYAFGVLWLSTDKIGSFFVRCGLAYASATPEPDPGNAPGGGIPKVFASDVMALHLAGFVMRGVSGMPLGSDAKDRESQQSTVGIVGNSPRLRVPITASEAKGEAKLSPLTRADPHITLFGKTSLTSRLQVGPFSRETTSELQACENTHPGSTDKLSRCCTKNKQNSAVVRKCGAEDAEGARRAITAFAASHLEKLVAFSAHVGLQIVTNPNDRKRVFSKKRIHRDVYLGGQEPPSDTDSTAQLIGTASSPKRGFLGKLKEKLQTAGRGQGGAQAREGRRTEFVR
ncbi:hypothetical protein B0H14DRAFT_2582298 [Mycena olivaceomarginata]|nr:hypothetical protein B0H14DRAFT_2582298 [Mycena olivaceomarginata]